MILKNLFRRKGRTLLTVLGIAIGVAAIIGLGAMANGLDAGYNSMLTGSKADLVLSQPGSLDISLSSVEESIGPQLASMSEVRAVSGMLEGFVQTEELPFFFLFGYPEDSFVLQRFQILEGAPLDSQEAKRSRGTPILLGSVAAESLDKDVGETLRLSSFVYRIIGIYESGETFEDSGAVLRLPDAQTLLGKQRQVSLFYIQLKDPSLRDRLTRRVERLYPDLSLTGTGDFADKQMLGDMMQGYVWAIAGLAIVIGGVGMMNAQLMAVMERTREIGALRAMGWSSWRVLGLILGESVVVGLIGGILGVGLGWAFLSAFSEYAAIFGGTPQDITPGLLQQAFTVVLLLGGVGGLYPAWRAAQLQPVEALRYEGGSSGEKSKRLPVGGMAVQSLWQRTSRTLLTLGAIGLTVGGILALESVIDGSTTAITNMMASADAQIVLRQADIADTSMSAIDERTGEKIASLAEIESVSGLIFTAVSTPDAPVFIIMGYAPNEYAIRRFLMTEGERISSNHQIMLGSMIASSLNKDVGDTLEISGSRFKVTGIYESGESWEELGGVISLRDAQILAGRPHKVTMFGVTLVDPREAKRIAQEINQQFPDVHAALTGEFVEQMPDMQNMEGIMAGISLLAIVVGGAGVMNTMLMSVLERTREIGVLRALGWRRRRILGLIIREALILGLLGGVSGIGIAFTLAYLISQAPMVGDALLAEWHLGAFLRALAVALTLGVIGGLYPAYRATRLQPVEALRYE